MKPTQPKWYGATILLGGLLLVIATVMHPIVLNPFETEPIIEHISHHRDGWMIDHGLMALALLLWLFGLSESSRSMTHNRDITGWYTASLAMWLTILAFELGGMPLAVEGYLQENSLLSRQLVDSLFASALIAGYFAMVPAWIGVALTASAFAKWGVPAGIIGVLGIIFSLLYPTLGITLWVLIITTAIPFAWTLWLGWRQLV